MELKEYIKRVDALFLPLDKKVKDETATEKEIIQHDILKNIFLWTEWITILGGWKGSAILSVLFLLLSINELFNGS